MGRLGNLFATARDSGEELLSIFLSAGYPELRSALELVPELAAAGVDFVELGLPFSDPVADGPVIQAASSRALSNGMSTEILLEQLTEIRLTCELPILVMSYLNPILAYGFTRFLASAESAGADGFVIPDLLPESLPHLEGAGANSSAGLNFMAAPNTGPARLQELGEATHDFLYCVSAAGVTGSRNATREEVGGFLRRARQIVEKPLVVGFGISSPEDAAAIAKSCDGVIVGSEAIRRLSPEGSSAHGRTNLISFVTELRKAVKGA